MCIRDSEDKNGNVVTSDLSSVTLTVQGTPIAGGSATLSGCVGSPVYGVVYFSNCNIGQAGLAYTLVATDSTDNLAASSPSTFSVSAGTASQLVFTTEPGGTSTGGKAFGTQPVDVYKRQDQGSATSSRRSRSSSPTTPRWSKWSTAS